MITRRTFVGTVGGGLLVAPLAGEAQPARKVYRIGLLSPITQGFGVEAFREGLRDLGYVEGHNIVVEHRSAEGRLERLPELAAELVRLRVDVIVTVVTQASLAAKNATKTIPIVMLAVGDPVGAGLVASLAQPGGNVTGTSNQTIEIAGKQLELLRNAVPKLRVVAVLWNPANPVYQAQIVKATEAAARDLGIQLRMLAARDAKEIDSAFTAMIAEGAEALLVIMDPVLDVHLARIAALAANGHLPSIGGFGRYAQVGGLMAYAANFSQQARRTAVYVDKILKGIKPGDLPVEQPTKFDLIVNLKTAKALGLTIPPAVLARADEVIH
jgi:putative tryptophan/tyrosine transport system substrate-binding protein